MSEVGLRDLRQNASDVVRRVEAGESFTVTVNGRPAARLVPVDARRRWRRADDVMRDLAGLGSDPDLADDLRQADAGIDQSVTDPYDRRAGSEPV